MNIPNSKASGRRTDVPTAQDETGGYPALWDWRRQVATLYAAVRAESDPERAWTEWCTKRDRLFRAHPQTPLEPIARNSFKGLPYYPYDASLRFTVCLARINESTLTSFDLGNDGVLRMHAFARTDGLMERLGRELTLFWLSGYGGGVFLPFGDTTNGSETYGAGRYLLDTIKSADLGSNAAGELILDFNFAYNPSCSYSTRYVCPLAPPVNRLPEPVRAGEKAPNEVV